jgi:hypothetical protein
MVSKGNEQDNTDATFDILFRGDIGPGNNIDQVKARVAESFKLDEAAVNQLFSGAVVSLKRNVDRATAERIYQRLSQVGALANIVPSNSSTGDSSVANESSVSHSSVNKDPLNQPSADNPSEDKAFTLAPLGSDVLEGANAPEQEQHQESVSVDHLGLKPVGSNILDKSEGETIEPVVVDTSHLTLE